MIRFTAIAFVVLALCGTANAQTSLLERQQSKGFGGLVHDSSGATYWGAVPNLADGPVRPYEPVNPAELPLDWDQRSRATRELMTSYIDRSACPTAMTIVDCWIEAPYRSDNPNVKQGFIEIVAILYELDTAVQQITYGKLPADYEGELHAASQHVQSGIKRAACDAVVFRFSNMLMAMPEGPYPVVGWNNQFYGSVHIDTVPASGDPAGTGRPQTLVRVYRGQARLAIPEVIFTRVSNPIVRVDAFHNDRAISSMKTPEGADGLITIPRNDDHRRMNDLHRVARNMGMGRFPVIVERGQCPTFDFAQHIARR